MEVNIIGAGLAGCECAYQLAKQGIKVRLFEMKKIKRTPAQKSNLYAELVCSNSLKSNEITNACGLLKEEMRELDSLLLKCADKSCVPAGQALSVDREKFSQLVTEEILSNKNIEIIVVDDNEPGTYERKKTEKIVEKFKENNLKYIKHLPKNS